MVEDKGTSDDNVLQSLWVTQGGVQLSFKYQGHSLIALNKLFQCLIMIAIKKFFFLHFFKSEFFVFHPVPLVH